jgi:predicted GNAT family N-acyltransferase
MATVRRVGDGAALADAVAVREAVFVEEQGVPPELERDDADGAATTDHFVAYDDGRPVGTARLRPGDGSDDAPGRVAKAERVAVVRAARGRGVGRELMAAVEDRARERGFERVRLHAQRHVETWYRAQGYETTSDEFVEAGIPHVEMEKALDDGATAGT